MITQTEKYKVILENPWMPIDTITDQFVLCSKHLPVGKKPESYPDVFAAIYQLEDGTELCLGEPIWRSKNYEVRSTNFNQIHIAQNTPIFGTRENCEKWLEKNAKNIRTELLKQNRDSSFQTLKAWVNKLDDLSKVSYDDLLKIKEGLNTCIENIENSAK